MKIRHATEKDFIYMLKIYAYARQYMADHGNPNQWGPTNWPPEALIHADILAGNSYVCVNDQDLVIGTFYFAQGLDIEPTYRKITEGSWMNEQSYGVVHRLAGDGSEKGIGACCLDWAYEQCGHLRVDTHTDNKTMQSLLEKLGFKKRGIIFVVEDPYPRIAYEKD